MMPMPRTDAPPFLIEKGPEWTRRWLDNRAAAEREQQRRPTFAWPQHGGEKVNLLLLQALLPATRRHCAYCDHCPLGAASTETIDHFRPKGRAEFADLAFAWENLFPACNQCQQEKAEKWDDRLLKPDANDYSFERYFIYDMHAGDLLPNPAAPEADRARASVTVELLGLNSPARRDARKIAHRIIRRSVQAGEVDPQDLSYRFLTT